MNLEKIKTSALFMIGITALAVGSVARTLLIRTHHGSDVTDFVAGISIGIGIGMFIFVAWRSGRRMRPR